MWFYLQRMVKTEHPTPPVVLLDGLVRPSHATTSVSVSVSVLSLLLFAYLQHLLYMHYDHMCYCVQLCMYLHIV